MSRVILRNQLLAAQGNPLGNNNIYIYILFSLTQISKPKTFTEYFVITRISLL